MCDVGSIYVNDCPVQRYIPIYLIVGGAFSVFMMLFALVLSICVQRDPNGCATAVFVVFFKIAEVLLGCFSIFWYLTGESDLHHAPLSLFLLSSLL